MAVLIGGLVGLFVVYVVVFQMPYILRWRRLKKKDDTFLMLTTRGQYGLDRNGKETRKIVLR